MFMGNVATDKQVVHLLSFLLLHLLFFILGVFFFIPLRPHQGLEGEIEGQEDNHGQQDVGEVYEYGVVVVDGGQEVDGASIFSCE